MVKWRPAIRRDDFWGDLANTMLLRPAYRMSRTQYLDSGASGSETETQRRRGVAERKSAKAGDALPPLGSNAAAEEEPLQMGEAILRETKSTIDRYRALALSEPQLFGRQFATELIHFSDRLLHAGLSDLALEAIREASEILKSLVRLGTAGPGDDLAVPPDPERWVKPAQGPGLKTTDLGGPQAAASFVDVTSETDTLVLSPYLSFRDNAREAMNFYQSVFGGELTFSTFGDYTSEDPAEQDKLAHAVLVGENGLVIMGADTPNTMDYTPGNNFSLSLRGEDEDLLNSYFKRLAEDGTITVPLEEAPWGDIFGMLTDKFGVAWLVSSDRPH